MKRRGEGEEKGEGRKEEEEVGEKEEEGSQHREEVQWQTAHLVLLQPTIDQHGWLLRHGLEDSMGNGVVRLFRALSAVVLVIHARSSLCDDGLRVIRIKVLGASCLQDLILGGVDWKSLMSRRMECGDYHAGWNGYIMWDGMRYIMWDGTEYTMWNGMGYVMRDGMGYVTSHWVEWGTSGGVEWARQESKRGGCSLTYSY